MSKEVAYVEMDDLGKPMLDDDKDKEEGPFKMDDKEVYNGQDGELHKWHPVKILYFFDLATGNARSRALIGLIFGFLLATVLFFADYALMDKEVEIFTKLEFQIRPPAKHFIGQPMPTFTVRLQNENYGPVPNTTVFLWAETTAVVDLQVDLNNDLLDIRQINCGGTPRIGLSQYYRHEDQSLCEAKLSAWGAKTNEDGIATFEGVRFLKALSADYVIKFFSNEADNQIGWRMTLVSPVEEAEITKITANDIKDRAKGVEEVILGKTRLSISGTVRARSGVSISSSIIQLISLSVDGRHRNQGTSYIPDPHSPKLSWFTPTSALLGPDRQSRVGDFISADFNISNLIIHSASQRSASFGLHILGKFYVATPYPPNFKRGALLYNTEPEFPRASIWMKSNYTVDSFKPITDKDVTEGSKFIEQPRICIKDPVTNLGIPHKRIVARISRRPQEPFQKSYAVPPFEVYLPAFSASLGLPNPRGLMSPVSTSTDSEGCARFKNLRFDQRGAPGEHEIQFWLDGKIVTELTWKGIVQSSLPPTDAMCNGWHIATTFTSDADLATLIEQSPGGGRWYNVIVGEPLGISPSIQTKTAAGQPLEGKVVSVKAYHDYDGTGRPPTVWNEIPEKDIQIQYNFNPSNEYGWIVFSSLLVKYMNIPTTGGARIWVKFMVDGFCAVMVPLKINYPPSTLKNKFLQEQCAGVVFESAPDSVTVGKPFDNQNGPKFSVYPVNYKGEKLKDQTATIISSPVWGRIQPAYLTAKQTTGTWYFRLPWEAYFAVNTPVEIGTTSPDPWKDMRLLSGYEGQLNLKVYCREDAYSTVRSMDIIQRVANVDVDFSKASTGIWTLLLQPKHSTVPMTGAIGEAFVQMRPYDAVWFYDIAGWSPVEPKAGNANAAGTIDITVNQNAEFFMPGFWSIAPIVEGVYSDADYMFATFPSADPFNPVPYDKKVIVPCIPLSYDENNPYEVPAFGDETVFCHSNPRVKMLVGVATSGFPLEIRFARKHKDCVGKPDNSTVPTDLGYPVPCGWIEATDPDYSSLPSYYLFATVYRKSPLHAKGIMMLNALTDQTDASSVATADNIILGAASTEYLYRLQYTFSTTYATDMMQEGVFTPKIKLKAAFKDAPAASAVPGHHFAKPVEIVVYEDGGSPNLPINSIAVSIALTLPGTVAKLEQGFGQLGGGTAGIAKFDSDLRFTKSSVPEEATIQFLIGGVSHVLESPPIRVTKQPAIIKFLNDPPSLLPVDNAMNVRLGAYAEDGTPMENVKITCEMVKRVSLMEAIVKGAAGHDERSLFYSGDCYGPGCGEINEGIQWSTTTQADGTAGMLLIVTAGITGNYTMKCAAISPEDASAEYDSSKDNNGSKDKSLPDKRSLVTKLIQRHMNVLTNIPNFAQSTTIEGPKFEVYSDVASVEILDQPDISYHQLLPGQLQFSLKVRESKKKPISFSSQPKVRIIDTAGDPLVGVKVLPICFPLSKDCQLDWDDEIVSDEKGEYQFKDLQVVSGKTGKYVIIFFCKGVASKPSEKWQIVWKSMAYGIYVKTGLMIGILASFPLLKAVMPYSHIGWAIGSPFVASAYFVILIKWIVAPVFKLENQWMIICAVVLLCIFGALLVALIANAVLVLLAWLQQKKNGRGSTASQPSNCCIMLTPNTVQRPTFATMYATDGKRGVAAVEYTKWLLRQRRPDEANPLATHDPDPPKEIDPYFIPTRMFVIAACAFVAFAFVLAAWLDIWQRKVSVTLLKMFNLVPSPDSVNTDELAALNLKLQDSIMTAIRTLAIHQPAFGFLYRVAILVTNIDFIGWWKVIAQIATEAKVGVWVGMIVAVVLSIAVFGLNWFFIVKSWYPFQKRMRRGDMRKEILSGGITFLNVERGIGLLVWHFMAMTSITFIAGFLGGFACSSPTLLWTMIKFLWKVILTAALAGIATKIVHVIITKLLTEGIYLKRPRIYHIWSIFDISMGLAASLIPALLRFVFVVLSYIVYFCRFDVPQTKGIFLALDAGHWGYITMHALEHLYQNPIVKVFEALLLKDRAHVENLPPQIRSIVAYMKESEGTEATSFDPIPLSQRDPVVVKRNRIVNKWRLALILHQNPSLKWFRKHNLRNMDIPKGEKNPLFSVAGLMPFFSNGAMIGGLLAVPTH